MKLFPSKELTIETFLTKEQVIERLNSLKRPQKTGFWNSLPDSFVFQKAPAKRNYTIKAKGNLFTIYLDYNIKGLGFITTFYRRMSEFGISPRIEGVIYENRDNTTINMVVKPPKGHSLRLPGIVLAVMGFIGFILLFVSIVKSDFQTIIGILIFTVPILIVGSLFYAITDFYITDYANKMHPFLTQLFEDK